MRLSSPVAGNVFISYSREDRKWLQRLQAHLKPLARAGLVVWDDSQIKPGDNWKQEIQCALDKAKVAVLLISANFFASDFINEKELKPILIAAQRNGVRVLPVIVGASRFQRDHELAEIQSVNSPDRPLNIMSEGEQEKILDSVAQIVEHEVSLPTTKSSASLRGGQHTLIAIDIIDWRRLDKISFSTRLFDALDNPCFDHRHARIKLIAKDLERLIEHIYDQSNSVRDPKILVDQRASIEQAKTYLRRAEEVGSELLSCALNIAVGRKDVILCIERFIELCMTYCVGNLACVQLASEDPLYAPGDVRYGNHPELCQLVYECPAVVDVVIAEDVSAKPHVVVYVPLGKLENTGGNLITNMYEPCTYIRNSVWVEYVIPQMAFVRTLLSNSYWSLSQDGCIYCTEGKVFRGSRAEYPDQRIGATRHFVVPDE